RKKALEQEALPKGNASDMPPDQKPSGAKPTPATFDVVPEGTLEINFKRQAGSTSTPKGTPILAADELAHGEQRFKQIVGELQQVSRLTEEEKIPILADIVKRAEKLDLTGGHVRHVVDQSWNTKVLANGSEVHEVTMTLGQRKTKNGSVWFSRFNDANEVK